MSALSPDLLRALRLELAGVLTDSDELRLIARDADLPVGRIDMTGPLEVRIHSLLEYCTRAGGDVLERLLTAIDDRYPDDALPTVRRLLEPAPALAPSSASEPESLSSDAFEYDAFIYHSARDSIDALNVAEYLEDHGLHVLLPEDTLAGAGISRPQLRDGIHRGRHLILLLTEGLVGEAGRRPPEVRDLLMLIERHFSVSMRERRLFLFLAEDCDIPEELRSYPFFDARSPANLKKSWSKVARTVLELRSPAASPIMSGATAPRAAATLSWSRLPSLRGGSEAHGPADDTLSRSAEVAALIRPPLPPVYRSEGIRELSEALQRLYERRAAALQGGRDVRGLEEEIARLRRQMRQGPVLSPGEFINDGQYLLLERVGAGTIGTNLRAFDFTTRAEVLVKVLHPAHATDVRFREQYFGAVGAMSMLRHPGIVRVLLTRGEDLDFYYFVQEYLSGGSLEQAILSGRLKGDARYDAVLAIGEALSYAHEAGIFHGHVNPRCLLYAADGRLRITSFEKSVTQARGRPPYMSPEAESETLKRDARSDVYSLAMTALYCLYGRELPPSLMRRPEDFIRQLACPEGLKSVLLQAIEPEPEGRHPSMKAFCKAVQSAIRWQARVVTTRRGAERLPVTAPTPGTANPFRPGPPLSDAESPPGRLTEIQRMVARLETGGSLMLLGPRRGGKTSLLHHLRSRLAPRHSVRFVNLELGSHRSPDDIACTIEPGVRERKHPAEALQQLLHKERARNPVLLIDEVGYLRNADLEVAPTVFSWLRALGQGSTRIVYAGSYDDWRQVMDHARKQPGSSFGNDLLPVTLRPLSQDAALAFLATTAPRDVPLDPEAAGRWIIDCCGTWPFYLQVMGHALVEEVRAGRGEVLVNPAHVRQIYKNMLLRDHAELFRSRWIELPARARAVLLEPPQGLPDFSQLSLADRDALRSADLYDSIEGWRIADDQPFLEWIELMRPELRDRLRLEVPEI